MPDVSPRVGDQVPRIYAPAQATTSTALADASIEFLRGVGMGLFPWQEWVLRSWLGQREPLPGERPGLKWSAFQAGLVVPRQNGKGTVLEARELLGLCLYGEGLIVHTAHEQATSSKHYARMEALFRSHPALRSYLLPRDGSFRKANGQEAITLKNGCQLEFRTRSGRGGRGFSGDVVVLDEAMYVSPSMLGALVPTMATRPNPQLILAGSAVDAQEHPEGLTMTRIRNAAIRAQRAGRNPEQNTYAEWSSPTEDGPEDHKLDPADLDVIASANPSYGLLLSPVFVTNERTSMPSRQYAVERLGVGDWPVETDTPGTLLARADVEALADATSRPTDPVVLGIDVDPLRTRATIVAASWALDGRKHVEVVDQRPGVRWLLPRLLQLVRTHDPAAIVIDERSAAKNLVDDLRDADLDPTTTTYADLLAACAGMLDAIRERELVHPETADAGQGAGGRLFVDAACSAGKRGGDGSTTFLFARGPSGADITPLMAATVALWKLEQLGRPKSTADPVLPLLATAPSSPAAGGYSSRDVRY